MVYEYVSNIFSSCMVHCVFCFVDVQALHVQVLKGMCFSSLIADITPPRLTFISDPIYTNANVTISWRYDEEAASSCTLQTPTTLFVILCNESVSLTGLREGGHTFYIVATDLAGNVARTVRNSWTVGEFNSV
jgi:hypothetical protein